MMQNSITKLDIKALYELSLSIGKSLDFRANCQSFTAALKKSLKQDSCEIWVKSSINNDEFKAGFKNGKSILKIKTLLQDAPYLKSLATDSFFSFGSDDVIFLKNANQFYSKKGVITFLKASASMFLVMQNYKSNAPLSNEIFEQLKPLIDQFSISLEACIKEDQLLKERTQSQNINEELRQYKMMVDNISDGIIISDLGNNVIFVNDQLAKMSGYEKEMILGSKTEDLHIYNDRINDIEKKIKRSFKGFQEVYEIAHINKKNQREWWAEVKTSPFKDRNGKIIGAIAVIRDITVQKKTELSLKENEWKLRNFFEKSPVGIAINDGPDNAIINERFCEMLGYTKKEFTMHKLVNEITFPEEKNINLDGYKKLIAGKTKSFNIQKRYIKKNGSIMWGNLTLSILKDDEKGAITHFAMVEDIHDKKIMNDSLAFINQLNTTGDPEKLFNDIAKKIASTFEVPYVLVTEIDSGELSCSSRSFWKNGAFSVFNYSLQNSPCQDAINRKKLFAVEENVQKKYPKFKALKDLKAESYIACPLFDNDEKVIGLIALLDTKKMYNTELIKRILTIYSNRVSSELERIRNNQILLDNTNKLREAEKLARIGSWEYDFESDEFYLSEGIYQIFKFKKKKTPPNIKELKDAIHPGDLEDLQKVIENKINKGKPWDFEMRYIVKDKTIHTINKGKASMANGHVIKLFGTIQDITDKKVAETNLMVATTKYHDLLENINDAVVILDSSQKIIDCNQAAQTILEYSKSELLNLNIRQCILPTDLKEAEDFSQKFKKDGFFRDLHTRVITKNKTIKYVKVDSDSIFENGKKVGSRDIFRDITELKETERKRELLYQKVEEANKELKDFAYIVSHDLKAPLRAIGSLAQWLSEDYMDQIDEKGQKHLTLLNSRVLRMHNFIDGILEYSRLGRIKISKESVNINGLIENVIDSLEVKNNQIKIKTDLPTIKCERLRIYQVFQNLISNSIKYNDKEKGLIIIDYKKLPGAHQFSIEDNGPGIDKKYHEKIFQIFQTLQIRDHFESTGIGLTIVKRIVELHGGTINVKSKIGKGATFEFTLSKD